jgi:hypothetical protein
LRENNGLRYFHARLVETKKSRLDDGFRIYKGHRYEAFYYTKDGWTSLGKQTAESNTLNLKAPRYALMYIISTMLQLKCMVLNFLYLKKIINGIGEMKKFIFISTLNK